MRETERRQEVRYPVSFPVLLTTTDTVELEGQVVNASRDGVLLEATGRLGVRLTIKNQRYRGRLVRAESSEGGRIKCAIELEDLLDEPAGAERTDRVTPPTETRQERPDKADRSSEERKDPRIMEPLLNAETAAAYLRVNKRTLYRRLKAHELPAVRVGRQWRFRKSELDAWLGSGRSTAD